MNNQETITKTVSQELNSTLPTYKELVKKLAGHEHCTKIVSPFLWACGHDDKTMISITMNSMCMKMQNIPFSENDGNDAYNVKDWQGNDYLFKGEEYDCILKIMFCSWMGIGIIGEDNSEIYYKFQEDRKVWKVLN